jgi:LPXTG-motif cell wall-anchored protein
MKPITIATGFFFSLGMSAAFALPTTSSHAAPGPVLGAGLPVLAAGYGLYWLLRRRKKGTQTDL